MLDTVLLLVLIGLIAALLVVMRRLRKTAQAKKPVPQKPGTQTQIILDGSNVMHWKDDTPRLQTLVEVITHLQNKGYTTGVIFDANAGYLVGDRYLHHTDFAKLLGLPESQVMVVSKGEPADPTILKLARTLDTRVVTNDKYRDWAEEFPDVRKKGFLVKGGYRGGKLDLSIPKAKQTN